MTVAVRGQRTSRRGYALVFALTSIFVLLMLAMAMFGLASTNLRTAKRRLWNTQALNLAMGGLDEAISQLEDSSMWSGFSDQALGEGTITVTVTTPVTYPTRRVVTSTGTINAGEYTILRSVRATLDSAGISPVFYRTIAAKTSLTLNGNITVDSYPTLHVGDVHCNQNSTHNGGGGGMVDGKSTATGTITLNGSPTITGGATSGVAPMTFPEVDATYKAQAVANGVYVGNLTVSDGSLVQGKITGNLTISGSGAVLSGVVWVTGTVTISGPVSGTAALVADGTIELETRSYDPRTDPSHIVYISTSTDSSAVFLKGNRQFKGMFYTPYGGTRLQGNSELVGGVLADTVTFGGNPHITRWTDFGNSPPPLPSSFAVKGWEEL